MPIIFLYIGIFKFILQEINIKVSLRCLVWVFSVYVHYYRVCYYNVQKVEACVANVFRDNIICTDKL